VLLTLFMIVMSICIVTPAHSQTTAFAGPVTVQSAEPPQAALTAERVGSQAAVLDLFPDAGGDTIRLFGSSEGNFLRSYFNADGAFYTNAWMVVSGSYSPGTLTPQDLHPTNDSFMVGVWADVPGPAVILRPNETSQPDADLTTMDAFGYYRMAVTADGSLEFAGTGSNQTNASLMGTPFASTIFDTVLHRVGPGQLRTEGNFAAKNYATPLLNNSGDVINSGTVLSVSTQVDDAFTISLTDADVSVIGIALTKISANAVGPVVTHGLINVAVVAPVTRGSLLVSAGNGVARAVRSGEVPPPGAIIGKALMSSGGEPGTLQAINVLVQIM
jgi:hypothetical protein